MGGLARAAILLAAGVVSAVTPRSDTCKSLPGDIDWPPEEVWNKLNQTIGGQLIATVPVASVCHVGGLFDGRLNTALCSYFKSIWNFSLAQ
jgi:hypothetical protein